MRKPNLYSALLLAAITMSLAGCSRNPVAPELSVPGGPGATGMASSQDQEPAADLSGGTPGWVEMPLVVGEEGTLTAGRFTLFVHKNSLKMPATIRISVANPEAMECNIVVSPPQAGNFQVAAQLSANLTNVPNVNYDTEAMYFWDGSDWQQDAAAAAHPNQQNVVGHVVRACPWRVGPGPGGKGHKTNG